VDTFVSSDAPRESQRTAYAPLGSGFVIRVVESINFAPPELVSRVQELALAHDIPVQLGMTSGGTDGQPWLAKGIPSMPISWPGRYSHSPIEVLDLRDLDSLVRIVMALAEEPAPGQ
jgi:putative aminopeptidase FrvX